MLIESIPGIRTTVGESPIWDSSSRSLWFVDILEPAVLRLDEHGDLSRWATPRQVGAVALADSGTVAVALDNAFTTLHPSSGDFAPPTAAGVAANAAISEGKVDRDGRFVAVSGGRDFSSAVGAIHRWEPDGSVTELDDGFILGNGLCWSVDGSIMYVADSKRGVIYAYEYGTSLGERRVFARFDDDGAFPDGATVDEDDHVWTILHGSKWLIRMAPDGREVLRIDMPSPNITSLAFGGHALDEIYVTSLDPASIPDAAASARDRTESGLLYRISGSGFVGVPETRVRRDSY
ncbi:SMP-30/gluconolactonase/LRE family protein [Agreia bicolorata]|uniref:SMP-30/gluconolactonase/LRE family protein n=1 Tax=Agreia bicolorata TaxID=110935 RepID=UPI0009FD54FC|nr:SMP-30/gluconolactonase/LRE family protein [Agreia bicolorata]